MAGREIVNRQVNIYIQSGEAQKAYDALIKKEKILNEELDKTTNPKRMKALRDDIDKLKEPIDRTSRKLKGELLPTFRDLETASRKMLNEFKRTGDPETLRKYQALNGELVQMKSQINGMATAQQNFGKTGFFSAAFWANLAANGVMRATAAFSGFFRGAIDEALEADEATTRLSSTLSNLGRTDAFDRIARKAQEMANKFRFLDNDEIVGVFNKLIDYGKLTEKEMNDLLPVIINFAAKARISVDEATSVIVKALEGNAKALKEYGISLKDTGDETERLQVVTDVLGKKVEGAAEAFQNSAKGGIAVYRQELKNLKEDIGNDVLPLLNKLLLAVRNTFRDVKNLFFAIKDRFAGRSALISFNLARVDQEKVFQEAITNQAEVLFPGLDKTIKLIESSPSLGRKLDLKNKEDELILKNFLAERYRNLQGQINQYRHQLDRLIKEGKNIDTQEAVSIKIGLLARQKALDEIDLLISPQKDLGINQGGAAKKDNLKNTKKEIDDIIISIRNLGDVVDKELQKRSADISADKLVGKGLDFAKGINDRLREITGNQNRDRLAFLELQIFATRGQKRLTAEKNLLDEQMRQELLATNLTENEKELIRKKFLARRQELERNFTAAFLENLAGYAQGALNILTVFGEMNTRRENTELERDRLINDRKQRNLESRLRSGKLTQQQYDRELQKLEAERDKREKAAAIRQFNRSKRANISQAIIDGIMAVSQVIRTVPKVIPGTLIPNPEFPIILGATIAAKLATIAGIAAQKPPVFARGGKLGGAHHNEGGNPIIDGKSGRKIAEIEKGEGIINRRSMADGRQYSVSGTPNQIASLLNSMGGGVHWAPGGRLMPGWYFRKPTPINYAGIKRYYAGGGTFGSGSSGAGGNDSEILNTLAAALLEMQQTNAALQHTLSKGIMAYTLLGQLNDQQERMAAIEADRTMR